MTGFIPCARTAAMIRSASYAVSASSTCPRACEMSSSAMVESCCCPGVRTTYSGRALVSTRPWIFVEKPPRERPKALHSTPLFRPRHPDALARPRCRRCCPFRRHRAAAPRRSSPTFRAPPSCRTGYKPTSTDRNAPAGHARGSPSSPDTPRHRSTAGRLISSSALDGAQTTRPASAPIVGRKGHGRAQLALITLPIPAQISCKN